MRWRGSSRPTTSGACSRASRTRSFSSARTKDELSQLREPDTKVRLIRRRRPRLVRGPTREGLRLSRPERLGEVHDDPDAGGAPQAPRGPRDDAARGAPPPRRARPGRGENASRVHEPEILSLSRPDGGGEPDVLRIDLRPPERAPPLPHRGAVQTAAFHEASVDAHGRAFDGLS